VYIRDGICCERKAGVGGGAGQGGKMLFEVKRALEVTPFLAMDWVCYQPRAQYPQEATAAQKQLVTDRGLPRFIKKKYLLIMLDLIFVN
jgi:hypothetical protein